jgi:hypothetical protein
VAVVDCLHLVRGLFVHEPGADRAEVDPGLVPSIVLVADPDDQSPVCDLVPVAQNQAGCDAMRIDPSLVPTFENCLAEQNHD